MASISLQDLRRRLYVEAKADKTQRVWGLYVHVVKPETLRAAYDLAKRNNGAPGIDGVTFDAIEAAGLEAFLAELRDEFRRLDSQPVERVIAVINPILRGWVNYFGIGNAARCFGFVQEWVEKKVRRHLMRARGRRGFGWKRWSREWLHTRLGLFHAYRVSWRRV